MGDQLGLYDVMMTFLVILYLNSPKGEQSKSNALLT